MAGAAESPSSLYPTGEAVAEGTALDAASGLSVGACAVALELGSDMWAQRDRGLQGPRGRAPPPVV